MLVDASVRWELSGKHFFARGYLEELLVGSVCLLSQHIHIQIYTDTDGCSASKAWMFAHLRGVELKNFVWKG